MEIPDEKIEKLQQIYRENYGIWLSERKAREEGQKILEFMEIIYQPVTKEEYEKLQERREETQKTIDELFGEDEKPWY